MITLESFTDPLEANVLRALLESEGIPAFVADEQQVWMNWYLSHALGGAKLQVPAEHERAARAVLAAYRAGEYQRALEEQRGLDPLACPRCGCRERVAVRANASRGLAILAWSLAQTPFPPRQVGMRCAACGEALEDGTLEG
jgi:hypothetical protein